MVRTPRVDRELAALGDKFPGTRAVDEADGSVTVIIPDFPTSASFTAPSTRIAVRVPALYPTEKLDLFWLDPTTTRRNGAALPNLMAQGVALAGEPWTQISWHDNSPHDPRRISILSFVRGIRRWFDDQAVTA